MIGHSCDVRQLQVKWLLSPEGAHVLLTDAIARNKDSLTILYNFIKDFVVPVLINNLGGALGFIGKVAGGILDVIGAVVNGIKSAVNFAIDAINVLIRAYNAVPLLPNVSTISKPSFSAPSTPSSSTLPKIATAPSPSVPVAPKPSTTPSALKKRRGHTIALTRVTFVTSRNHIGRFICAAFTDRDEMIDCVGFLSAIMTSYNYSYNVLINRLEAFAAGHFLIKRFTHGQIDMSDQLQDDQYPFMIDLYLLYRIPTNL